MKVIVWMVFVVLAAVWTVGALLAVELVQWGAQLIASGAALELGSSAAQWPAPAWLALWLDPAAIEAAQRGLVLALEALRGALPWIGSAVGWLVPLVWICWGAGMALLLTLAGVGHWLIRRGVRLPAGGAPGNI